jgi:hypothetical protein
MDVDEFLTRTRIPIKLACITTTGWPVTISLWYAYLEEKLFCATQKNTLIVVKYLSRNSRCGFEVARDSSPYLGVRGWGQAKLNETRGSESLHILIKKYLRDETSPSSDFLLKGA